MSGKQKTIVISLGEKVKILKRLKNGEARTKLAGEYDLGKSMLSDIRKNEASIINFVAALESDQESSERKSMKRSFDVTVDSLLHVVFTKALICSTNFWPLLCEKALIFNEKLKEKIVHFK